jgi:hypothetical protein
MHAPARCQPPSSAGSVREAGLRQRRNRPWPDHAQPDSSFSGLLTLTLSMKKIWPRKWRSSAAVSPGAGSSQSASVHRPHTVKTWMILAVGLVSTVTQLGRGAAP